MHGECKDSEQNIKQRNSSSFITISIYRPNRLTQCCTQFKPFGIKRFVPVISISFKYECYIIMQIQYTKNLNPGGFELGTALS